MKQYDIISKKNYYTTYYIYMVFFHIGTYAVLMSKENCYNTVVHQELRLYSYFL